MPLYYKPGDWNFVCDLCGRTEKASNSMRTWEGNRVCAHHRDIRNPQDYVRAVHDNPGVPWTRTGAVAGTPPADVCTIDGRSSLPGLAIPGCSQPRSQSRATNSSIPHLAWPGMATPGVMS